MTDKQLRQDVIDELDFEPASIQPASAWQSIMAS
jgi:hypothetical protein